MPIFPGRNFNKGFPFCHYRYCVPGFPGLSLRDGRGPDAAMLARSRTGRNPGIAPTPDKCLSAKSSATRHLWQTQWAMGALAKACGQEITDTPCCGQAAFLASASLRLSTRPASACSSGVPCRGGHVSAGQGERRPPTSGLSKSSLRVPRASCPCSRSCTGETPVAPDRQSQSGQTTRIPGLGKPPSANSSQPGSVGTMKDRVAELTG